MNAPWIPKDFSVVPGEPVEVKDRDYLVRRFPGNLFTVAHPERIGPRGGIYPAAVYLVEQINGVWVCDCPDPRQGQCKHCTMIEEALSGPLGPATLRPVRARKENENVRQGFNRRA